MTALTPAVQDAAYRLGWALEASGLRWRDTKVDIMLEMVFGASNFTPEAEAERVEAAWDGSHYVMDADSAAGVDEHWHNTQRREGALNLNDTQGQVPDAFDEWARGFGDE